MPSRRKRIGYLPSINIQEIITNIANKEKLSQSKVVGKLVEEALIARGEIDIKNINNLIRDNLDSQENNMSNSAIKFNEVDELISDKGIIYNAKKYMYKTEDNLSEPKEIYNAELFEQFKQFILFQKTIKINNKDIL